MLNNPFPDIPESASWRSIEPLEKGWSADKKYVIKDGDGGRLLLRVTDIGQYERKQQEFEHIFRIAGLGVPTSLPLAFGICGEGALTYSLFTWVEGEPADMALPRLPTEEQHQLGRISGEWLRRIHTLPALADQPDWGVRYTYKAKRKIQMARECPIPLPEQERYIAFIEENLPLVVGRSQCFQHGDYHAGNLVVTPEGNIGVIDYNRCDYGDPWEEFNRIVFSGRASPAFASGQLQGYFMGEPTEAFFRLMALYIAVNALSSLPWAISFGEGEIKTMMDLAQDVLEQYRGFTQLVPAWYRADG